jgi:insulysin
MGHEGPGSLLSFLKKKNWASYLNAGLTSSGIGFSFFDFMIDLTEEGLGKDSFLKRGY